MKAERKRDRYSSIIRGTGIVVCIAALALLLYLIRIVLRHGMDVTLLAFLFVPFLTFAVGCFFISLAGIGREAADWDPERIQTDGDDGKVIKRIGILSDTHGLIRPQVREILQDCDYIIHAGDLDTGEVLGELRKLASLYVVRGNNDNGVWADSLEDVLRIKICGMRFLIVHDRKLLSGDPGEADIVIFGHSHKYYCEQEGNTLWLNPGSCGRRRFRLPVTMAVMEIGEKSFRIKQHILEEPGT